MSDAKFGCCVRRWKELKSGRYDSREVVVSFRGEPGLEHTNGFSLAAWVKSDEVEVLP
jgi:hypothetical protein